MRRKLKHSYKVQRRSLHWLLINITIIIITTTTDYSTNNNTAGGPADRCCQHQTARRQQNQRFGLIVMNNSTLETLLTPHSEESLTIRLIVQLELRSDTPD